MTFNLIEHGWEHLNRKLLETTGGPRYLNDNKVPSEHGPPFRRWSRLFHNTATTPPEKSHQLKRPFRRRPLRMPGGRGQKCHSPMAEEASPFFDNASTVVSTPKVLHQVGSLSIDSSVLSSPRFSSTSFSSLNSSVKSSSVSSHPTLWPVDLITPPIDSTSGDVLLCEDASVLLRRMLSTILVQHCIESLPPERTIHFAEVGVCPVVKITNRSDRKFPSVTQPSQSNSFETLINELHCEGYLENEASQTHLMKMELCTSAIVLHGESNALKLNHADVERIELLHYEEYIAEEHRVSLAGDKATNDNAKRAKKKSIRHKYRMCHARFLHWSKYRASSEYLDIDESMKRISGRYSVRLLTRSGNVFFIYFQKSYQRMYYLLLLRIFHSSELDKTPPIQIVNTIIGSNNNNQPVSNMSSDSSMLTDRLRLKSIETASEDYLKVTMNFLPSPRRWGLFNEN